MARPMVGSRSQASGKREPAAVHITQYSAEKVPFYMAVGASGVRIPARIRKPYRDDIRFV